MAPSEKQIKVSALSRLLKDKHLYVEELKEHEQYVKVLEEKLEADAADEETKYIHKSAVQIKDETERMIPSVNSKIKEVLDDLKSLLSSDSEGIDENISKVMAHAEDEIKK